MHDDPDAAGFDRSRTLEVLQEESCDRFAMDSVIQLPIIFLIIIRVDNWQADDV